MGGGATFGEYFKRLRVSGGQTLRRFCVENNFDPGNISRLERGLLQPPDSRDRLAEYALALGLNQGTAEWEEFFRRADIARGQIPQSVLNDEQLLSRLPFVFRTLEGKQVTAEQIDQLVELIRRNEAHG